ncbi:hypothetical protein [Streptomyces sp. NPDC000851]
MKKNNHTVEGSDSLVYTARLPLSSATLNYLADLMPLEEDRLAVAGAARGQDRGQRAGGAAL